MRMHSQLLQEAATVDFQLVVQKLRREFAHARNFLFKTPANVRGFSSRFLDNQLEIDCTGDFKSVVLKSRRESAHARTFGGDFELKFCACADFRRDFGQWT